MPANAVFWISQELKYGKKNSSKLSIRLRGSNILFTEFFKEWNLRETWTEACPQPKNGAP
ncbi:hypothetical protein VPNG_05977 [Cytospora leucostoma]|uniref:Uncharacterized protein n=1 Tax=Cytospora leucostoma TaxID=1230097 RepID=A0A423XAU8_9PEZI|nr:hypothetical protein VPNG_05977 [Cytospora leucostoma]